MKQASHIVVFAVMLLSVCAVELIACSEIQGTTRQDGPAMSPSNCIAVLYVTPQPATGFVDCVTALPPGLSAA